MILQYTAINVIIVIFSNISTLSMEADYCDFLQYPVLLLYLAIFL